MKNSAEKTPQGSWGKNKCSKISPVKQTRKPNKNGNTVVHMLNG